MRATRLAVLCAGAAAIAAASASALSTTSRISHAGLGAIKLGMTERQIERADGRAINLRAGQGLDCATATLAGKTYGLFTRGRLRRIYVNTPRFATRQGIRVTSSEQRVLAAYPGKLVRKPQHYSPQEDELILRDANRKIVFTLDDGKVAAISSGRVPEIDLVEGCS